MGSFACAFQHTMRMIVDCSDGVLGLLSVFARQTQGERIRPLCVCEWNTRPYYYGRMGRGCTEHTIPGSTFSQCTKPRRACVLDCIYHYCSKRLIRKAQAFTCLNVDRASPLHIAQCCNVFLHDLYKPVLAYYLNQSFYTFPSDCLTEPDRRRSGKGGRDGKGGKSLFVVGLLVVSLPLPPSHLLCVMMIGEYAGKYITSW